MRRIIYAALMVLVFVLAALVGTVLSAMFLNGVSHREAENFTTPK